MFLEDECIFVCVFDRECMNECLKSSTIWMWDEFFFLFLRNVLLCLPIFACVSVTTKKKIRCWRAFWSQCCLGFGFHFSVSRESFSINFHCHYIQQEYTFLYIHIFFLIFSWPSPKSSLLSSHYPCISVVVVVVVNFYRSHLRWTGRFTRNLNSNLSEKKIHF